MKRAGLGAVYGLGLLVLSAIIGSSGEGIFAPLVVTAAPFPVIMLFGRSVVPIGFLSLIAVPFLWGGLALATKLTKRWVFLVGIAAHYILAGAYVVSTWHDDFDDPYRDTSTLLHLLGKYLLTFGLLYIAGQIWLWYTFVKFSPAPAPPTR